ncbi:MAG: hypothetical protein LQ350_000701 [Teloschistes chrysophthalmus]|nr:MAG: hypothetical protein LQ350_000701 [Niorma chrysophthalma]
MVRLVQTTNKLRAMSQSSVHGEHYQACIKVRILGLFLVRDAIVGLNQTAVMLGSIYNGHFVRTLATVSYRDVPIAVFEYTKSSPTLSDGSDRANSTGPFSKEDLELSLIRPTLDTDLSRLDIPFSGWATSEEDPRLRIHFEFSAEKAGGGQIFMVSMDALAIAGSHPLNTNVAEPITATGLNDVAETRLRVEPSGAPGTTFYWRQFVQALVVLWEQVIFGIGRPRWNILDQMWIRYDGTTIAYAVMTTRLLAADTSRS